MNQTKRILIINYEFPPLGGGGGVAAKKLALDFIATGALQHLSAGHKHQKKNTLFRIFGPPKQRVEYEYPRSRGLGTFPG